MLKDRRRYGVAATSRSRGGVAGTSRSRGGSKVAPPEVGIIPANRFFLLPVKKVTALVRAHTPCRDPSATSTKPCITTKAAAAAAATKQAPFHGVALLAATTKQASIHGETLLLQQHSLRNQAYSKKLMIKQRHRHHSLVTKSTLSTVAEQLHAVPEHAIPEREPLLWNNSNNRDLHRRSFNTGVVTDPAVAAAATARVRHRSTSVFTLNEPPPEEPCRGAPASSLPIRQLQDSGGYRTAKKRKKKLPSSFYNTSNTDFLGRKSRTAHTKTRTSTEKDRISSGVRSFGRNNRVSPSSFGHGVEGFHPRQFVASFGTSDQPVTPRFNFKSRNRSSKVGCSAVLLHKIRSRGPFLCSFTNEKDLPDVVVGPAPLHLRHLHSRAAAPVEVSWPGTRAGFGTQNFLDI